MIIQKLKTFIIQHRLMASNLVIGYVAGLYLYAYYLQSHQNYYLDLFQALVACEGLVMSFYLGFKLKKTRLNVTTLRAEEERLKLFTQLMEEAILIRDGETVVEVNDVLARMLGYEISEMIGRDIYRFMAPQEKELHGERIKKGYPSNKFELTAKRKDGTTFPILVQGKEIVYKGRPMRLACGWDITEFKKMQATVRKSEDRFKHFAEVTREGILIHEKGVIVDVNQALADMIGIPPSDFIGKDSLFFVDEESADLIRKFRANLLPTLPYEITVCRSNGMLIQAETYATDILWGGREARVVRIWDVSERKKIEKALVESQERFQRFAEVTKEGIFVHDKGVIVDANQALADMLGYSIGEMIGKNNSTFLEEESNERALQFRKTGYPIDPYEVTLRRKDGTFIPVEVHGAGFGYDGRDLRVVRLWNLTDRKKMDKALMESQERFKRFAEVSKEGIVIHENGVAVDVNEAGAAMMGYTPGELIGRSVMDVLDDNSKKTMLKVLKEGGSSKTIEMTLVRKDKTTIPVEVTGMPFNFDGRNLRIVNFWDLSFRKKMEEALRQSEQNFRNLIEKSPDAMTIHTPEKTVYVNEALLKMLGYSNPDELVGQVPEFFVYSEDAAKVRERINKLKKPGDYNPPAERRFVRKDGTLIWVDVVSFSIYFEGILMTVAVSRDNTERKKAEEALRQSEKNFRNLIEKSPDGVLIHTLEEEPKIVYINEAMFKFVGYQSEELIGKKADYFVHSRDVPGVRARIEKMRANVEFNPPQEKMFIRKDGQIVYAEAVSFLIHYAGIPMGAVVARDLTERKKAEEALMKLERLSTIGEMAAGMAHEIRNPLAAISSAAQILIRKKIKEDNGQLETILGQSDRLEKLVRDTLDYAKIGAGLPSETFSIKPVLENALNLSQIQFGPLSKNVNILWDVVAEDIRLKGDPGRIQQILVNLILNAFQIMVSAGVIILSLHRDKDFVFVRVADNGPGISDDNMKRMFEPFFTTKNHGSGLGLALSQRIAQEHGGQIKIERLAPRGTAFILELPLNGESKL